MKNYLYHRIPEKMKGDTLYPLNKLENIEPEIYKEQASKYEGREFVMDRIIPTLDCLWNDVLHMSPVDPNNIKEELAKLGQSFGGKFLKIDPEILDRNKTTVYLFNNKKKDKGVNEDNFTDFKIEDLPKYSKFPESTADYYKKMIGENKRPLLYVWIPHILYKGTINITDGEVIEI